MHSFCSQYKPHNDNNNDLIIEVKQVKTSASVLDTRRPRHTLTAGCVSVAPGESL